MAQRSSEKSSSGGAGNGSVRGAADSSLQQVVAPVQPDLSAGPVPAHDGAGINTDIVISKGLLEDTSATQFAKAIPVMMLKLESRACGLLAAWMRDTVILVDASRRAEEM